jgi:hypothetical protein
MLTEKQGINRDYSLFGSRQRTRVLILLRLLGESYPTELAKLLAAPLYSVQSIVDALEREGVVVSQMFGNTRRVSLNPRYVGAKLLSDLLWEMGKNDFEIQLAAAKKRRRPRRRGKTL